MPGIKHTDKKWYAVRTRSKCEKSTFRDLQAKSIGVYLPLLKKVRQYNRKRKEVELPLISCYVFVCIGADEYVSVLESPNVVDYVRFGREMVPIPEAEIDLMRRILGEGWEVSAQDCNFNTGDLVEIAAGNLIGVQGYVTRVADQRQILINLKHVGMGLQISVDRHLLLKVMSR